MQTVYYGAGYVDEETHLVEVNGQMYLGPPPKITLEPQFSIARSYLEKQGDRLQMTHAEHDKNCDRTTDPLRRPKLAEILSMLDLKLFGALVIYRLDRISPDSLMAHATIQRLRKVSGVHIFCAKSGWDTIRGGQLDLAAAHAAGL